MRRIVRVLLVVAVLAVVYLLFFAPRGPDVEPGSVLVLELQGEYVEAADPPLLARFLGQTQTPLLRLYSQLRKAERDQRLGAVVFRIRGLDVGWGKAQEIRDAIGRLRASGRKTVAYLEVEPIGANIEYYVASAAEEIYMAPGTRIPFVGLAAEFLFLGGLWEKLGVELEVERVGAYKTAADFLAGHEMSDAHREMANWLLDSLDVQFVSGVAEGRGVPEQAVRAAIQVGPSSAEELRSHGLVDGAAFLSDILKELGEERAVIRHEDWARVDPGSVGFEPVATVALVYGSGNVVTGEGHRSPSGAPLLASERVARALTDAAEDAEVDAILFRIDSPGGSALASDLVWHATQVARREKPLVVSFSDVAASGGYYVASGADAIVAQPGTITGSIGVLLVRPVLQRLYEKIGVGTDTLTRGPYADVFLLSEPLDEAQRARLAEEVRGTYELFLDRVASGRDIERARLDDVARGRVWTGAQAEERGLVDSLGGLHGAVARVRESLKLDPGADVSLLVYPQPEPLAVQIREFLEARLSARAILPLPLPRPAERVVQWLETLPSAGPALLPPLALEVR